MPVLPRPLPRPLGAADHDSLRPERLQSAGPLAFSTRQARGMGVSPRRLRAADLIAPAHGLRARAGEAPDRVSLLRALVAATPGKPVISHATAAWLWGMWLPARMDALAPVHVSKPRTGGGRVRRAHVRPHQLPPEALEDLALEDVVVAAESLLQSPVSGAGRSEPGVHPRCTRAVLGAVVEKRRNIRGRRLLAAALEPVREGSGSPAETRLRLRLVRAGFPEPRMNQRVVLRDGSWIMPDLVWEESRICLECEGDHHRVDRAQFRADIGPVRRVEASGWSCLRVSEDVWTDAGAAALISDLSAASTGRRGADGAARSMWRGIPSVLMGEVKSVGVFALQGDVREHVHVLEALGARTRPVRRAADLEDLDGIVLPGGESSVMDRLARIMGLKEPLAAAIRDGLPAYGTCAGMIMLASSIENPAPGQGSLGVLDMTVRRNAFGAQVDSFEADLDVPTVSAEPVHAVFIRAPAVLEIGDGVEVLASVPGAQAVPGPGQDDVDAPAELPVAVRAGHVLATSFHPEVTGDWSFHREFLRGL